MELIYELLNYNKKNLGDQFYDWIFLEKCAFILLQILLFAFFGFSDKSEDTVYIYILTLIVHLKRMLRSRCGDKALQHLSVGGRELLA